MHFVQITIQPDGLCALGVWNLNSLADMYHFNCFIAKSLRSWRLCGSHARKHTVFVPRKGAKASGTHGTRKWLISIVAYSQRRFGFTETAKAIRIAPPTAVG